MIVNIIICCSKYQHLSKCLSYFHQTNTSVIRSSSMLLITSIVDLKKNDLYHEVQRSHVHARIQNTI